MTLKMHSWKCGVVRRMISCWILLISDRGSCYSLEQWGMLPKQPRKTVATGRFLSLRLMRRFLEWSFLILSKWMLQLWIFTPQYWSLKPIVKEVVPNPLSWLYWKSWWGFPSSGGGFLESLFPGCELILSESQSYLSLRRSRSIRQ